MTIRHLALLLLFASSGACARLDHFKVYEVSPQDLEAPVELTGQFDEGKPRPALVRVLTLFANPVAKRHRKDHPIVDKMAHLTWYKLDRLEPEPIRTVRYKNQFGGPFSLDIGRAVYLLAPAEKVERGSVFPENLDHYKCYEVIRVNVGGPLPVVVLTDQFGKQQTQVGKPLYFCVPVRKDREGEQGRIRNRRDHLLVYGIDPKPEQRRIKVRDQFGSWPLTVRRSVALCVPTEKLDWAAHR